MSEQTTMQAREYRDLAIWAKDMLARVEAGRDAGLPIPTPLHTLLVTCCLFHCGQLLGAADLLRLTRRIWDQSVPSSIRGAVLRYPVRREDLGGGIEIPDVLPDDLGDDGELTEENDAP